MTTPCVVGTIGRHSADVFVHGDLPQQVWQHWAVAVSAGCKLHRPDVGGGGIHRQMDLAPLATTLNTVLAGLPFTVTEELDPGAVHQQVQRPIGTTIGYLHLEGLLPAAQRRVVWNGPVQPCQTQEARDHPGCLPERQLEQNLERQAELDRGIRKDRRASWASLMRRVPGHLLVQPDQQRPALPERIVVGGPVCRAVAGGLGLAHAARLTAWIPDVNPSRR